MKKRKGRQFSPIVDELENLRRKKKEPKQISDKQSIRQKFEEILVPILKRANKICKVFDIDKAFITRAEKAYPKDDVHDEKSKGGKYLMLKRGRYEYNMKKLELLRRDPDLYFASRAKQVKKEDFVAGVAHKFAYSAGKFGYEWISLFTKFPKDTCQKILFNANQTNIMQYCNNMFVGKIVNTTTIDKNGAYVSHLIDKVPVKEVKEKGEDTVTLYTDINGKASFMAPRYRPENFTHRYFKLGKLQGIDEWYEQYQLAMQIHGKKIVKKLGVAGIGYMLRYQPIITRYIWFKQGQEIQDLEIACYAKGLSVVKIHTDSITWVPDEKVGDIEFDKTKYKYEHQNKNMYMVNQGLYQVEGDAPKGLPSAIVNDTIEYEDGEVVNVHEFPCLRIDKRVKTKFKGEWAFKSLKSLNIKGK